MSMVLKKTKQNSAGDLVSALNKFIALLEQQNEHDAIRDLQSAVGSLETSLPDSDAFQSALQLVLEAYEGDHELKAYTLRRQKQDDNWTEAEELYLASIEVLNIVKRLLKPS